MFWGKTFTVQWGLKSQSFTQGACQYVTSLKLLFVVRQGNQQSSCLKQTGPLVALYVSGWDDCFQHMVFRHVFILCELSVNRINMTAKQILDVTNKLFVITWGFSSVFFKSPVTFASYELLWKCLLPQLVLGEQPGLAANCVPFFFFSVIVAFSCLMENSFVWQLFGS